MQNICKFFNLIYVFIYLSSIIKYVLYKEIAEKMLSRILIALRNSYPRDLDDIKDRNGASNRPVTFHRTNKRTI